MGFVCDLVSRRMVEEEWKKLNSCSVVEEWHLLGMKCRVVLSVREEYVGLPRTMLRWVFVGGNREGT